MQLRKKSRWRHRGGNSRRWISQCDVTEGCEFSGDPTEIAPTGFNFDVAAAVDVGATEFSADEGDALSFACLNLRDVDQFGVFGPKIAGVI